MLNLITTIDVDWLPYACMMLAGARRVTRGNLSCWIVQETITPDEQGKVLSWAGRRDINLHFVDARKFHEPLPFIDGLTYTSSAAVGRYLPTRFLPREVERVVYVDVDILMKTSIEELMTIDLEGKTFGAVACPILRAAARLGIPDSEYINNGVLVMDVWRFPGDRYVSRLIDELSNPKLTFSFQCAFNLATKGEAFLLDPTWNVQNDNRAKLEARAHVIHFTGQVKPWHYLSTDPLRDQVRDLILSTPYPQAWEPDRTVRKMLRRALRRVLKR